MEAKVIGTHNGPFHADDVMACTMLKLLPEYTNAKILRSREEDVLAKCDIVVDVGEKFSHQEKKYDHHQAGFELTMEQLSGGEIKSTIKLSSAGLIFFYYGKQIIREYFGPKEKVDPAKIDWVWQKLYFNLIKEIDLIDNNGSPQGDVKTGFSARVGRLNPDWDDPDGDFDQCFTRALTLASEEFLDILKELTSQWRAKLALKEKMLKRYEDHKSGHVLVFEKYTRWNFVMDEVEKELGIKGEILFVVDPRPENNEFGVSAVFKRCLFPIEWGGLSGEELKKLTGLAGAKFVHNGRHLAKMDNKEDAITLVKMMLGKRRPFLSEKDSLIEKVKELKFQGKNEQRAGVTERAAGSSNTAGIWKPGTGSWTERRERRRLSDGRGGDRRTPHS